MLCNRHILHELQMSREHTFALQRIHAAFNCKQFYFTLHNYPTNQKYILNTDI